MAPVLARLVRERIEALVDESVGALAALLERWRSRIKAALPDLDRRRRFYESAVRGEAARQRARRPAGRRRALACARARAAERDRRRGSVALVGAVRAIPGC